MNQPTFDDFATLDIRVGRILEAAPLEGARKPAYTLRIDFGPDIGERQSSAQITDAYTPESLINTLILAVVNFPPKRIAGFTSECLVLGVYTRQSEAPPGPVVLIRPDNHPDVRPGDRLG